MVDMVVVVVVVVVEGGEENFLVGSDIRELSHLYTMAAHARTSGFGP